MNFFEQFVDSDYGTCFRFNSGRNLNNQSTQLMTTSTAGLFDGLLIELNVPVEEEDLDLEEIFVVIHNHTERPYDPEKYAY